MTYPKGHRTISESECSRQIGRCVTVTPNGQLVSFVEQDIKLAPPVECGAPPNPSPHILTLPTILVVRKNKQPAMISPLEKKHLHLKNGMRWDSLLLKNVSKATKKLAFTK